jgi:hypothetical protein
VLVLSTRESEEKIGRETLRIPFELLVQALDRNAVEFGQIRVENDFLIAQDQDFRSDPLGENDCSFVHERSPSFEVTNCDLKEKRTKQHSKLEATRRQGTEVFVLLVPKQE